MGTEANTHHSQGVLFEVQKERDYQDDKWGTEFDDKNTLNDWVCFIADYSSNAAVWGLSPAEARTQLIKAAALAVAAVEAYDRNDGQWARRHYDHG